jgi:hypothetical protein
VNWLWEEDPDPLAALAKIVGPDLLIEVIRQA